MNMDLLPDQSVQVELDRVFRARRVAINNPLGCRTRELFEQTISERIYKINVKKCKYQISHILIKIKKAEV